MIAGTVMGCGVELVPDTLVPLLCWLEPGQFTFKSWRSRLKQREYGLKLWQYGLEPR